MIAFIDENKGGMVDGRRLGLEPICETLQVALSTYYAARDRPLSRRARRDAELTPRLTEIWKDNYQVYGVGSARGAWAARLGRLAWFLPPPPRTVHAIFPHTALRRSSPPAFSVPVATAGWVVARRWFR